MLVNKGKKEIIIIIIKIYRKGIIKGPQKDLKKTPESTAKTWHRYNQKKGWEGNDIVTTTNIRVCLLLRVSEKQHVSFF